MAVERKVRVGVIGAGGISQVAHIPNLLAVPSAELAAVCDTDSNRAALVADRFEIPAWFDQPERMLQVEKLDCVLVATPTISHLPLCKLALESGADVLIEKPFARNFDEARQMVETAERTGRLLMIGMNHRFRDDTALLKQLLESGELGELLMVRSGWLKRHGVWGRPYWFTDPKLSGGGVLLDLGIQMLDLVLYLLGFPTVVEMACGISHKTLELEVEDTAVAFIRFADEVVFSLEVSWANYDRDDVAYTLFSGSLGGASLNPLRFSRRQRNRVVEVTPPGLGDLMELYRRSFKAEISHFIECVQRRTEPLSNARQGLQVQEVIEGLYRSSGQ